MSVAAAAAFTLGVVEMHGADGVEPDDLIELAPGRVPSCRSRDVVTGGEGMAGVQASADLLSMLSIQVPTDIREMLESPAEVRPLAGGILQQDAHGLFLLPADERAVEVLGAFEHV